MCEFRISAKDLGRLAMSNSCPRCFWVSNRVSKMPYSIFPGIFSSIDSYTKKVTNGHFDHKGKPPAWMVQMGNFIEAVKTPGTRSFFVEDEQTQIRLSGIPDEILRLSDGSTYSLDYKTARFTSNQDFLMPIYEVQLNGYAYIANRNNLGPVSGLALIYYEPANELLQSQVDEMINVDGFKMPFKATVHPIKLDSENMIPALLQKAREIFTQPIAPSSHPDCADCKALAEIQDVLKI